MKKKHVPILFLLMVFISAFIFFSEKKIVILESDFTENSYWYLTKYHESNNVYVENGVLHLFSNDTQGLWSWSKAMRGIMPHQWDRYERLNEEIEMGRGLEAEEGYLFLDIIGRRKEMGFYDESELG